jgi:hypothetical protein
MTGRHRSAVVWPTATTRSGTRRRGVALGFEQPGVFDLHGVGDPQGHRDRPGTPTRSGTWASFLRSQADALLACDFLETVTLTGARLLAG